jgi:hypothetical protein
MTKKQVATPIIGAHRPDHRGKDALHGNGYRGALPRLSGLNRPFSLILCPDYRAPSKNLPSGSAEVMSRAAGRLNHEDGVLMQRAGGNRLRGNDD